MSFQTFQNLLDAVANARTSAERTGNEVCLYLVDGSYHRRFAFASDSIGGDLLATVRPDTTVLWTAGGRNHYDTAWG